MLVTVEGIECAMFIVVAYANKWFGKRVQFRGGAEEISRSHDLQMLLQVKQSGHSDTVRVPFNNYFKSLL